MAGNRPLEVTPRLASQPIGYASRYELGLPWNVQHEIVSASPQRNDTSTSMCMDAARRSAQREDRAMREGRWRGEPLEPLVQPGKMLPEELLALSERGAGRESKNREPERLVDAQDDPSCAPVPFDDDGNAPAGRRDGKSFRGAFAKRAHRIRVSPL
jgi:hypothetical protein